MPAGPDHDPANRRTDRIFRPVWHPVPARARPCRSGWRFASSRHQPARSGLAHRLSHHGADPARRPRADRRVPGGFGRRRAVAATHHAAGRCRRRRTDAGWRPGPAGARHRPGHSAAPAPAAADPVHPGLGAQPGARGPHRVNPDPGPGRLAGGGSRPADRYVRNRAGRLERARRSGRQRILRPLAGVPVVPRSVAGVFAARAGAPGTDEPDGAPATCCSPQRPGAWRRTGAPRRSSRPVRPAASPRPPIFWASSPACPAVRWSCPGST